MLLRCFGAKYQWDIITSPARFLGVFMGRRVGKTFACYQRAAYKCLDRAGFRYAYICQNNPLAEKVYQALVNNPALKPFILKPVNRSPFKIIFRNGSYIEFWNYDKIDKIRGNEYDEVWAFPPLCKRWGKRPVDNG